ncbi:hypothetical protein CPter291_4802 [Collimonas pratensis]|uniref:Uncharacterized protein n=1 Tax=Collimonas pratensis TaxID=279113 RepID=A0A127R500_9BURK|nr:hypothetical protein CPter91_0820 [Collimonas pratensis]AMP06928.1 hypothetical protein CPter91_4627 [Collimonas pratensis]AMP07279.1 hypothetical protein CPter91_4991 [Collimonas pratensis]AMP13024.1 hypothetical protein CPter291_0740 [Collimonas pratensis]AMP16765.1 hypothetical protein CPter291_4545 [Collimonas pratensis]
MQVVLEVKSFSVRSKKVVDEKLETLHNLISLLLTNKTI